MVPVLWREKDLKRGEGGEEPAEVGGLLASSGHGDDGVRATAVVCVDVCSFCYHPRWRG